MAKVRLTPAQFAVLRHAAEADGKVYRSEAIGNLYQSFDRAQEHRNVTQTVNRLTHLDPPLLQIGEQRWRVRPWLVTEAGREVLAAHEGMGA